MLWSEIKLLFGFMSPEAMAGVVDSSTGTLPELALYARMIHSRIAGMPHKFSWLIREYTLTLTGATEYDLKTLIPDLSMVFFVRGDSTPAGVGTYVSNPNIYRRQFGSGIFTIQNGILRFDTPTTSGTLTIPYYSKYLVEASNGTRKLDFTADTDVTVVPYEAIDLLIEGMQEYVYRKEKKAQYVKTFRMFDGRVANIDPFSYHLERAIMNDRNIAKAVYDFRFSS